MSTTKTPAQAESAYAEPETGQTVNEAEANTLLESHMKTSDPSPAAGASTPEQVNVAEGDDIATTAKYSTAAEESSPHPPDTAEIEEDGTAQEEDNSQAESPDTHNEVHFQVAVEDQDTPEAPEAPEDEETPGDTELENVSEGEIGRAHV